MPGISKSRCVDGSIREFGVWRDLLTAVCGYFTSTPRTLDRFRGNVRLGRFGSMDIAEISGDLKKIQKTRQDVSRSDDANLFLILGLEGEAVLEQGGSEARLGVGDICLIDSRRPSEFRYKNHFKQISVHLPEMQTREVFRNRDVPLACTLKSTINQSLRQSMLAMYANAHEECNEERNGGRVLQTSAVDLMQNEDCLIQLWQLLFDGEELLSREARRAQLCRRVNQYIEEHLTDPDLDMDAITEACAITRRTLYRIFERHGLSPSNWIRMRRLERARNELMVLRGAGRCTDVAFKYGFNSSAHFSRVFKNKFGLSPRKFQSRVQIYG